ncbi:MAG TPA: methyltransferase [Candidatus Eisenbacteria bacterium]|nr:methyltransferase [Candidatus Eisenbacteria bacterium]
MPQTAKSPYETGEATPTTAAPPPHVQLVQMGMGAWVSQIVHVAAQLEIADLLAPGPKTAEELAGPTGTSAGPLYRFLRGLANLGILTESSDRRFGLTALGEALKTGAPGSARASILSIASDWWIDGWRELAYSLRTGKSGFEKALGMPVFDYLAQQPEKASLFSETMIGFHGEEPAAISAAYDFSGISTLADIGGATGHLLATVLAKHPTMRGILFDLPHVVADAPALLAARGMSDRVKIEKGTFFDRIPEGADAYLLSHVIHDWSEPQCLTILGHCRRAMRPDARLLIVEMVLPSGGEPHPGKMLDLMMLVGPGGQERTAFEFAALLEKAGFRLTKVVPTSTPVSVVEAVPAQG